MNNIDYTKVRAAVAKYRPPVTRVSKEVKAAVDSAIRKPLKAHGKPCTGFTHPHFLNGNGDR